MTSRTTGRTDAPADDARPSDPPGGDRPAVVDVAGTTAEPRWTIDQLAQQVGVPSRTIRHYQSERVLPPPERDGRLAYYRPHHAERIRLIGRLQDRGLSLKAVRDALKQVERGTLSLEGWLGLGDQLRRPWTEDVATTMREPEVDALLAGRRPGLRAELVEAGLLEEVGDGGALVRRPALLDIVLQLDDAGVDVATAAEAGRIVRRHVGRAADELVAAFLDRAGEGFGRSAEPDDLTEALERLRHLGAEAVRHLFAEQMQRAAREGVDDLGTTLDKSTKRRKERS